MNKGKHSPSAWFIKTWRSNTFCTLAALVYIKAISYNCVFYMIAFNQHGNFSFSGKEYFLIRIALNYQELLFMHELLCKAATWSKANQSFLSRASVLTSASHPEPFVSAAAEETLLLPSLVNEIKRCKLCETHLKKQRSEFVPADSLPKEQWHFHIRGRAPLNMMVGRRCPRRFLQKTNSSSLAESPSWCLATDNHPPCDDNKFVRLTGSKAIVRCETDSGAAFVVNSHTVISCQTTVCTNLFTVRCRGTLDRGCLDQEASFI